MRDRLGGWRRHLPAAAAAMVLSFCLGIQPALADRVRLVVLPFLSQAPIFIALEEGMFAREGIEIERVPLSSSYLALPGLMAGELDAAIPQAGPALFNAVARGGQARLVASGVQLARGGCSYAAFFGNGLTLAALTSGEARQVSISADPLAFEGYLVDLLRRRPGAERLQVIFREMPVQAQQAALTSRALDLAFLSEPWMARMRQAGIGTVAVGGEELLPDAQFTALMFSQRLLNDANGLGRRFLRAYLAALRQYNEGATPRNLDIIARATRLPQEILSQACWPSMPSDGALRLDGLEAYQRWLLERRAIDRLVPMTDLVATVRP